MTTGGGNRSVPAARQTPKAASRATETRPSPVVPMTAFIRQSAQTIPAHGQLFGGSFSERRWRDGEPGCRSGLRRRVASGDRTPWACCQWRDWRAPDSGISSVLKPDSDHPDFLRNWRRLLPHQLAFVPGHVGLFSVCILKPWFRSLPDPWEPESSAVSGRKASNSRPSSGRF